MADKAWKAWERKIAKYIGGERVPVTGRARGSAPDIDHAWMSIEVKLRKSLPKWQHDAMAQAIASAQGNQSPVVIMAESGMEVGDAWIMLQLREWKDRFGA